MAFSDQPHVESLHVHQCWDNHHTVPLSDVQLLQTLTNSFPLYATSLARKIQVSAEVTDEVYENWAKAAQGMNMVWVNGRLLNENEGSAAGIFGRVSLYTLLTLPTEIKYSGSCALCNANALLSTLLLI